VKSGEDAAPDGGASVPPHPSSSDAPNDPPRQPARRGVKRRKGDVSGRRWGEFNALRDLGIFAVTGVFFATFVARIVGLGDSGQVSAEAIASLLLLAVTFLLVALWGWSSWQELGMLRQAGGEHVPAVASNGFLLVVGAAGSLGALGVAAAWPLAYALLLIGLKVFEDLGYLEIRRAVARGFEAAREHRPSAEGLEAIRALEGYYLRHPWRRVHAVEVLVAGIAAALAGVALLPQTNRDLVDALELVSYALLLLVVIGNEVVVAVWRRERDSALPEEYR